MVFLITILPFLFLQPPIYSFTLTLGLSSLLYGAIPRVGDVTRRVLEREISGLRIEEREEDEGKLGF